MDSLRPGSVSSNQLGPRWTIHATRPLPERSLEHHFGSRVATVIPVELLDSADSSTCAMESFDDGWLFLIPSAPNSGWLLALGAPALHMLSRSQTIAASVSKLGPPTGEFPAYPRIASPLCGPDWLACGTAAMAFDPICGDGTGHAIREAILASAVIQALAKGAPPDDLSAHYEARLTAAFRRHLLLCREFYSTAGSSPLWTSETAAIDRGIQWCDAKLGPQPSFRYQLRGFELEAVR